ncbi:zinc finger BED domain-containing protein isoform X2 [Conger conger]|uniref:zinc finger BED domain-containing protein isoform X2 n=1 Tax=Conger conger TaxID=82655 RepID=UPI002A5A6C6E|nr:zinc finger BED domain-containing protein isoform X2 [Conger conger]
MIKQKLLPGKMAAKKRSVVWSFFQDDLNSKMAVCLRCGERILNCGNTTNLLKHLRSKHQGELTDATKRRRFSDVSRGRGPVCQLEPKQPKLERADIPDTEDDAEIHVSEMGDLRTEQEPFEGNEELGRAISDGINGALTLSVTKTRKRSAVWRYFQDGFDPNKVLCLVCSENIHYPQNTSNLLRHLRKKHPGEYADIEGSLKDRPGEKAAAMVVRSLAEQANGLMNNEQDGSEEQERIGTEEASRAVSDIVDEAFALSVLPKKRRSAVWSFYERGEDANKVLCLLCSEYIQYRQNTSNLLRHLRKKHPDKNVETKRKGEVTAGLDHAFMLNDYRSTGMPPGLVAPLTLEQAEQTRRGQEQEQAEAVRKALQQEARSLERERELTEQLRRAQQQEARALEQQRELTEQLRRMQEDEMRRLRELEARTLEQERRAVEQLRKTQEEEAKVIEHERGALEQLRRELEEDRRSLQRHWEAIRQGQVTVVGEQGREEGHALPGVVGGDLEMLVVTTT